MLEERNLKPLEDENERKEVDEEALYSAVMGNQSLWLKTETGNYKNYQNKKEKKKGKNKKKGQQ